MKHLLTHLLTFALTLVVLHAQTRTVTRFEPKAGAFGTRITVETTPEMTAKILEKTFFKFGNNKRVYCNPMNDKDNHTATSCGWSVYGQHNKIISVPVPKGATSAQMEASLSVGSPLPEFMDLGFEFKAIDVTSISPNPADKGDVLTITGMEFPTGLPDPLPSGETLQNYIHTRYTSSDGDYAAIPPHCLGDTESINAEGTEATVTIPECAISGKMGVYVQPFIAGVSMPPRTPYASPGPGFPSFGGGGSGYYIFEYDLNLGVGDLTISSFSPTRARVGEVIQISGTGFSATTEDNKVTFGNAAAVAASSWSIVGDVETLTLSLPADATTGKIKVEAISQEVLSDTDFTRLDHTLTDFNPKSFFSGQEIIIEGTNFATGNGNRVCFIDPANSSQNKCVDATVNAGGTELRCRPHRDAPSTGKIEVHVGDVSVRFDTDYTYRQLPPFTFTGVSPSEAGVGDTITITGTGLYPSKIRYFVFPAARPISPSEPTIKFSGGLINTNSSSVSFPIIEINEDLTEIKARVTTEIIGAEARVKRLLLPKHECQPKACLNNYEGDPPPAEDWNNIYQNFTVKTHPELSVTSFSPLHTTRVGEEVTVIGTGFSRYGPAHYLNFGNPGLFDSNAHNGVGSVSGDKVDARANDAGTELKFRVPPRGWADDIAPGKLSILYRTLNLNKRVITLEDFSFIRAIPTVTDFNPKAGKADTEVTIDGSGFAALAEWNIVSFFYSADNIAGALVAAHWVNEDGTQIKARVLDRGATRVENKLAVRIIGNKSAVPANRTIETPFVYDPNYDPNAPVPPVVSSFSPTEGVVDTEVTITGVNFSATPSANDVRFGGVMAAAPTSASTTSLTVLVPSGAVTGRVSVAVGGQTGTSSTDFTVTVPAAPVVLSFSPIEGAVDTEVTITGENFSDVPSENDVRFGGVMAASPTSASTTSLTVRVPSGAVTGRVSVAVGGQTATSSTDFTVPGTTPAPALPVVSSFSPSEGEVDTEVTITGVNFSDVPSENDVRFGGVMAAAPTSASTTSLTVLVPSGAVTGSISVAVGGQTGTSSTDFTVTVPAPALPVVSSFSPTEGAVDTEVTITGVNFSATASENEVRFRDVMAAAPTSATTTSLTVRVPSGAVTGSISVTVGGQTATSSSDFTVLGTTPAPDSPVVSSFSPTEGAVDTEVTITGVNFSATASENEVRFGGVMAAAPTSASTTSLTVAVPDGARTGRISVIVGGQTATSSSDFTVTVPASDPPVVSSFSPSEGEVDTEVTITGVNFSDVPSENKVRFGGELAASPTSATTTSLVVLVPSGAVTGRISVAVGGQTGTSSTNFTVPDTTPAPDPPVISGFSPVRGAPGTSVKITGQNFSEVLTDNQVKFGGSAATTPTEATASSLTVKVPSGARTGRIFVIVGGQTGSSTINFTVSVGSISITNIRPVQAAVGDTITISGLGFSTTAQENKVIFHGVVLNVVDDVPTTAFEATAMSLKVEVPTGAKKGNISVRVNDQTAVSGQTFIVLAGVFSQPSLSEEIGVYPNPTSGELRFTNLSSTHTYVYKLYSIVGQQVARGVLKGDSIVKLEDAPLGQYILILRDDNGNEILRTRLLMLR